MSTRIDGSVHLTIQNDDFPSVTGRVFNPALRYILVPLRSYFTRPAPKGPQIGLPPSFLHKRHIVTKRENDAGWILWDVTPRSSTGSSEDEEVLQTITTKRRIIYFHGGAYIRPINNQHWLLIALLASRLVATVTVVLYPLLPHNTADDVIPHFMPIYEDVRRDAGAHGKVILAGDSVGGSFVLILAQLVAAARDRVKVPDYVMMLSPLLDLVGKNPEIASVAPNDPWLTPAIFQSTLRNWKGSHDITDPVISPLYGDFPQLAQARIPLGLVIGTYDILEPDCRVLRSLAHEHEIAMDYLEWKRKPHVFPLFFQHIPESAVAVEWIVQKLERALQVE